MRRDATDTALAYLDTHGWIANENARHFRRALDLVERHATRACRDLRMLDLSAYSATKVVLERALADSLDVVASQCAPWFEPMGELAQEFHDLHRGAVFSKGKP